MPENTGSERLLTVGWKARALARRGRRLIKGGSPMTSVAAFAPVRKSGMTKLIVATSIGNALEWYDILIYGFFALPISKAFFWSQERLQKQNKAARGGDQKG